MLYVFFAHRKLRTAWTRACQNFEVSRNVISTYVLALTRFHTKVDFPSYFTSLSSYFIQTLISDISKNSSS